MYNVLLDENAPRALQQYIGFEDHQVHIDISKCYPNTLANNVSPIPLYSIHDQIEEYKGDHSKCGMYYIRKIKLRGFGNQLVLEAGFYSPTSHSLPCAQGTDRQIKDILHGIAQKGAKSRYLERVHVEVVHRK